MNSIVYGFEPHIGQERVIDKVLNSEAKYITVVSPRQIGKSLLLINLILYFSINDKNKPVIGVITPIYKQSRKIMKDLEDAIKDSGIIKSSNYSEYEMELKTGAKIIFRSSDNPDSIRGNTFDYLFVDEAAYHTEEAWKASIQPTALVHGKKVVIFSTPRGHNWFYDIYKMGESPDFPQYASVRMNQYENPLIDKEEIEAAKLALPEAIFRAEYLGEFLEGNSQVFSNYINCVKSNLLIPNGRVFCGLDLGRRKDFTVATFIDESGKVVDILKLNLISWETIIKELVQKIRKYNASVLVEINSIGDVIFEQLKNQWEDTHPFTTTNQTKKDIVETLILHFNNETIVIPNNKELIQELDTFEMTYNPKSRTIQYAAREPFHDDMVISLALANWHRTQNQNYGNYAVFGRKR